VVDTRLLWDERQRLIEDIRHLADVVLGTADDAIERLKLPEPLAAAEQEDEPVGSETNVTPIPHPLSIARDPTSDPSIPYDLESPEEEPDVTAPWAAAAADEEEQDSEAAAPWAAAAGDEEEQDPDATAPWAAAAADDDEQDPDARAPWAAAAEQDPDTTAEWAVEGDEDPETTAPYAVEGEYAAEGPKGEDDPDATAAWAAEADDDESPDESPADEDAGPQTVELEALPGGNTDDQAAEPERRRD
jgi:hypothetical protein